jgi:hypothetical protein
MAQVAFTDDGGLVAGFLESLGQGAPVRGQALRAAVEDDKSLQPIAHGIPAGHEGHPGGPADHHAQERRQAHISRSQFVDGQRLDVTAAPPQIGVAQIVKNDEDDVLLAY